MSIFDKLFKKKADESLKCGAEQRLIAKLTAYSEEMFDCTDELETLLADAKNCKDAKAEATFFAEKVLPAMEKIRSCADACEGLVSGQYWPLPTYGELLFSV